MDNAELDEYERIIREAQLKTEEQKIQVGQQEMMMAQQDKSMIKEQLDLGEELERIDYLLRSYTLVSDSNGGTRWEKPSDNDMIILSDYGVHLVRNTISWYLNKNTLLSNYEDDMILNKMEDFASDLNDTVFMEYEKVFLYPTFEDCKKIFNERIKKRTDLKVYALELLGNKVTDIEKQKIQEEILKQVEVSLERELEKIKNQIVKNKLKRFCLLIREIQDAIHSTYLRAWKGQERRTLREHIHISESKGGGIHLEQSKGGIFPWNKK